MATLTTQNVSRAGVQQTTTAATGGGDAMACGPNMFLYINNGGGSPITVTLAVVGGDPPGLTIADVTVSVTNAQNRLIGPLPNQFFADPITNLCTITYSGVTTVTVGAFNLTQP